MDDEIYKIYHTDALKTLESIADDSVDLIYLDPPFFTQTEFSDFNDKWDSIIDYEAFIENIVFRCYKVLKNTGCLFLHCDYHAEYEIERILRNNFGIDNIANKIYTRRAPKNTKNVVTKLRQNTDTIFFIWKEKKEGRIYTPPTRPVENKDRWASMTGGGPGGEMRFGNRWITPPDGRHFMWGQPKIDEQFSLGNIRISPKGNPLYRVLSERVVCGNLWDDIPSYSFSWKYDTQKHSSLLERIVLMGSPHGGLVVDPMCGSGTAAVAAIKLGRRFIGGDINEKAITITYKRLEDLDTEEYETDFDL